MKAVPVHLSAGVLTTVLWSVTLASTGAGQTQAPGQTSATETTQPQTQTAPSTPQRKSGLWRHFGEGANAPRVALPGSGVWHHFGPTNAAAKPSSHGSVLRQPSSAKPTAELEKRMYELINRDRMNPAIAAEAGGRALPLRWNDKLAAIARAHSRDMIRRGYFDHVDPDGRSAGDRLRAAGIPWQSVGENIAMDNNVPEAETAFMSEPRFQHNHRWNILNSKYTDVGVGIAQGPDGHYYITQEFMQKPEGLESSAEDSRDGEVTRRGR